MSMKKIVAKSIIIMLILFNFDIAFCENAETTSQEKREYEQDYKLTTDMNAFLSSQSDVRDLNAYEEFADRLNHKWRGRNKELYARLMLEICGPLISGFFNEGRQYELSRKYALSALEEPDSIPLLIELDLNGCVMTYVFGPNAVSGKDLVERRAKDAAIRLHAWRRLLEAIDPDWDPNEKTLGGNVPPPPGTGLSPGVDPAAIQDSALRAAYEDAIRINSQKIEERTRQYKYRWRLEWFQEHAEKSIIQTYSHPPFAIEELRNMLDNQLPDQEAKTRIIETVEKNMREPQEWMR